jgi:hypothetical protein
LAKQLSVNGESENAPTKKRKKIKIYKRHVKKVVSEGKIHEKLNINGKRYLNCTKDKRNPDVGY